MMLFTPLKWAWTAPPDSAILSRAAAERRIIVTADLDFPRLVAVAERAPASVVLFRGGDFNDATALGFMSRTIDALSWEDERDFVLSVDQVRIRRHWL